MNTKLRYLFLALSMILCLTGCGHASEETEPALPSETEAVTVCYRIRFLHNVTLLDRQNVFEGEMPEVFAALDDDKEGLRFIGWDKDIQPAQRSIDYHAVYVPKISSHVPYLFPRKDGFLHPEENFTVQDLRSAVQSLAVGKAAEYFPEWDTESEELTVCQLQSLMRPFFPDTIDDIFHDEKVDMIVTRSDAARLMNALLCRADEQVSPAANAVGFPDVSPRNKYYVDLMEASVLHSEGSEAWEKLTVNTDFAPGWIVIDGRARYLDSTGHLIYGKIVEGSMRLDRQGYYTSGNDELDTLVTDILSTLQSEHPEAERSDLLRDAFVYARDSFKYLRKPAYAFGVTGWEIEDAVTMLTTKRGNCYNYAAVFWALARGLGYNARAISGTVGGANGGSFPHGWVSIEFGEENYYFDTELEMAYRVANPAKPDGRNLYMLPRQYAIRWRYVEPKLANGAIK